MIKLMAGSSPWIREIMSEERFIIRSRTLWQNLFLVTVVDSKNFLLHTMHISVKWNILAWVLHSDYTAICSFQEWHDSNLVWNETEYGLVKDIRWEQSNKLLSLMTFLVAGCLLQASGSQISWCTTGKNKSNPWNFYPKNVIMFPFNIYLIRENIFIGKYKWE